VSDHGVTATDAEARPGPEVRPPAALATQQASDPVILTIGDIGVTRRSVVTPNGSAPLKGSQWIVRDATSVQESTPTWAMVAMIIFLIVCLLGLLFLLLKEKRTVGYVEVTVSSGNLMYMTQRGDVEISA
jgi:hypothetical protein